LTKVSAFSKKGVAVQISKARVSNRNGCVAKGAKGDIVED
jgi:hypothetical protein